MTRIGGGGVTPEPYWTSEDGRIVIYHGRAEDVLPHLDPVDLVLTDPPFGIGRDGKPPSTSSHGGHKGYTFHGWDSQRPSAETFEAVLRAGSKHVIWGGNYFADLLPPTRGWLLWDKGQRIDQADGELAWSNRDAPLRIYTLNRVALAVDGACHPTQKPLALMRWCLGFFPDAETILDPFAGSLTTAVAAYQLGRRCIAIEINEEYIKAGIERLRQGVLL